MNIGGQQQYQDLCDANSRGSDGGQNNAAACTTNRFTFFFN
jgi:hypothetical protein